MVGWVVGKERVVINKEGLQVDEVSKNMGKGKTYFVKSELKYGILVGRPSFTLVENQEEFLEEVKNCKISTIKE